jgi:hypothetical protein
MAVKEQSTMKILFLLLNFELLLTLFRLLLSGDWITGIVLSALMLASIVALAVWREPA